MKLTTRALLSVVFSWVLLTPAFAQPTYGYASRPALKQHYPERYVVKKGDTLWHISGLYLRNPWEWPKIWQANPQVDNPHLIYPGDELALKVVNGYPSLQVVRRQPVRLSPKVRVMEGAKPIAPVNVEALTHYLDNSLIINKSDLKREPYVVEYAQDRLIAGQGDTLYVKNLDNGQVANHYGAYRLGAAIRDPHNKKKIYGYAATHVGDLELVRLGEPATLRVLHSTREITLGDRVVPREPTDHLAQFEPHPPAVPVEGNIVAPLEGLRMISILQAAVINRGQMDGIHQGDVLGIFRDNRPKFDRVKSKVYAPKKIQLPLRRIGEMIVFRTFEKASFGLVLSATDFIEIGDEVRNP